MSISHFMTVAAAGALALGVALSPGAGVADPAVHISASDPNLILVSGGCGPYGWRGPYGGCRYGNRWRGDWGWGNGCPRGYWRGPWGHCRNTPYHGRLPNGNWKR
jgi:hypothetical protein